MTSRAGVALEAVGMLVGETRRIVCPFCNAKEKAMSITIDDDGSVLFHCFRAKCGAGGKITGEFNPKDIRPNKVSRAAQSDRRIAASLLTQDDYNRIEGAWGLTKEEVDYAQWHQSDDPRYIYMPVLSWYGVHRGVQLRHKPWLGVRAGGTKALTEAYEQPCTSWYHRNASGPRGRDPRTVVVVEDIPSAVRVSRVATGLAVLGSGLSDEALQEIHMLCSRDEYKIVFALDRDATRNAFKAQQRFAAISACKSCVLILPKDIKNMSSMEANDCLMSVL